MALKCIDRKLLVSMAENTGVFREEEIDMLDELMRECQDSDDSGYVLYREIIEDKIAGFAITGKTPCTQRAWDLYWFVVGKEYHGKGVAMRMMRSVESQIISVDKEPVIRVETSSRDDYSRARAFYEKCGFTRTGIIPNFYAEEDDLIIYHKSLK
jgi:ribosomal protein S18 acetylase RimI-like enzyme